VAYSAIGDSASTSNHLRRGAATVQHFRAGVGEKSANRLGCVELELIFTLTKVVIVLNFHEQRFEASMREAFELVTAARRHAGLLFYQK
jgi:hypothetical protein